MHEYGVVEGLLSLIDEQVRAHAGRRAVRVVLGITGASGQEHLLRDAFDTFKIGTSAGTAELVLEHAPPEVCCLDCGNLAIASGRRCPRCRSGAVLPARAQDIYLKSVEIEV